MLIVTFTIAALSFVLQYMHLNMGSIFNTRNITCIAFPGLTVSNKIIKISEYGKIVGID